MNKVELTNTAYVSTCELLAVCTALAFIFIFFMMRKARRLGGENAITASKSGNTVWNDVTSDYKCRHIACNRAPPPSSYPYPSDKKKWRDTHESSMKNDHLECRKSPCSHCIELFGVDANTHLHQNEFRRVLSSSASNAGDAPSSASSSADVSKFNLC